MRSAFSIVGFGDPVVFLANGLGVGLILGRRGAEDGEVEVEEELVVGVVGGWDVGFGAVDEVVDAIDCGGWKVEFGEGFCGPLCALGFVVVRSGVVDCVVEEDG